MVLSLPMFDRIDPAVFVVPLAQSIDDEHDDDDDDDDRMNVEIYFRMDHFVTTYSIFDIETCIVENVVHQVNDVLSANSK
jgi:hypothetical protein